MFLKEATRCKDRQGEHHYLESGGEPACGWRAQGGAAALMLYLGEINSSQQEGAAQDHRDFQRPAPTEGRERWLCFPKNALRRSTDEKIVRIRLDQLELYPSAPNGVLAGWPVCFTRSWSWTPFGLRSCRPAARVHGGIRVLQTLVSYRLIAPGGEWRLHREWFDKSAMWRTCLRGRLPPGGRRHALPLLGSNCGTQGRALLPFAAALEGLV